MVDAQDRENGDLSYDRMGKGLNSLDNVFVVRDSTVSGWVAGCAARGMGFPSLLEELQPRCRRGRVKIRVGELVKGGSSRPPRAT